MLKALLLNSYLFLTIILPAQKLKIDYIGFHSFVAYEDHKPPKRMASYTLLLDGLKSYGYGEILENENDTSIIKSNDKKFVEIYKDLSNDELIFKSRIIGTKKISHFSDSLHRFNWTITTIQKKIDSLTVFKAMCIWRGRAYTAWFAPSIPYSNGPEKFGGLPGLIIEIYSDGNEFYRRLKSLSRAEFSISEPPIVEGNYEYMVKKAKEYYAKFVEQITALDTVNPDCKDCKNSSEVMAVDLEFTYIL